MQEVKISEQELKMKTPDYSGACGITERQKTSDHYAFYAFLFRTKLIDRWGLMQNAQSENVQEHTMQVALIAHALCIIRNTYYRGQVNADKAAVIALFHDASEIITGDMPTPVKYFDEDIVSAYKHLEEIANRKILSMLPEKMRPLYEPCFFQNGENEQEFRIVKAADKLCAYTKCLEEIKAGNLEFRSAAATTLEALEKMAESAQMPEIRFFLEHFITAFSMTLDEQESL